jgi:hypothetical protein
MIKYICGRKPEYILQMVNNVINKSICDIVLKILMIENSNLEDMINIDNLKYRIIYILLSFFQIKDSLEEITNIKDIFIELIETTKNFELLVTESCLNAFFNTLYTIKNLFVMKEYLNILVSLLKQFKSEYEKAQKFVSSLSLQSK